MAIAGRLYGPERRRYNDPATEFEVLRLTDPAFASGLTTPGLRQFTRRGESLLHWSDRSGSRQAYLAELKDGSFRQLTDVQNLQPKTITLTGDDRSLLYFDGPELLECPLGTLKPRPLYALSGPGAPLLAPLADGMVACASGDTVVRVSPKSPLKSFTFDSPIVSIQARPRHSQLLVVTGGQAVLLDLISGTKKILQPERGQNEQFLWTNSGRSLTYLHVPEDPKQLITLRELVPDESSDKLLAKTSQFGSASGNFDASVFVGASRSKASSYVLILLRVTRRELTLCEHGASDPTKVQPMFAPDSQSVFFQSDRHGKSAIYRVRVEKFVEQTEPA